MNLYNIAQEIRKTFDADTDLDTVSDETFERFKTLNLAADAKIDAICGLVKEWGADAEAARVEAQRLRDLATIRQNKADRLKQYLMDCLRELGARKHETELFSVRLQANSQPSTTCQIDPEKLHPYLRRIKYEPDVQAAVKIWKETGTAPEGFTIVRGEHVRIS